MRLLENLRHYGRLATGMHAYMRTPRTDCGEHLICEQMEQRENRWLEMVRRGVFGVPGSAYGELFKTAGCEYGDLETGVRRDGLETTLRKLCNAGVYLTHDEYKGKKPLVRSGKTIAGNPGRFVNPFPSGWLDARSSGSRSSGTASSHNTAQLIHYEAYRAMHCDELDLRGRVGFAVRPVLPSGAGIVSALSYTRQGCEIERWFAVGGPLGQSAHYRSLTNYIVALARWNRVRVPFPTHLPPGDFSPVALAIAKARGRGKQVFIQGAASAGVRVAAAAAERGWDISGSIFVLSGEPVTDAKLRFVESAGVRVHTMYWITEIGPIGWGCRKMGGSNAVHLLKDSLAAISQRMEDPLTKMPVEPLLFTTLLPCASNLLINADMGDCATIEPAACKCRYAAAGFSEQVCAIWSYAKLTGQGMTLAGSDVARLLEEVLPARFGGAPGDFQLVEHDGPGGTTLDLRVHPRIGLTSTDEVRSTFLRELRRCYGGSLASRVWQHADSVRVVRAEPVTTSSGKVLSLHLLAEKSDRPR